MDLLCAKVSAAAGYAHKSACRVRSAKERTLSGSSPGWCVVARRLLLLDQRRGAVTRTTFDHCSITELILQGGPF